MLFWSIIILITCININFVLFQYIKEKEHCLYLFLKWPLKEQVEILFSEMAADKFYHGVIHKPCGHGSGGEGVYQMSVLLITVNSLIKDVLVFNFWTFGAVFYSAIFKFFLNKSPNFHDFFSLLFETSFNSKQSSIKEFTLIKLH